ncbi:hypothetical protein [Thermoflavimicrobium daqui]|uniref:Uncharacterized protein n=1 Tax=Thermoflavimicrobium daqui TaxID=2137476 RepID=A0A364K0F8_9BACL|nr:hypothetical protein [Thermoflavimicrobium daqui]RAL20829.1 hypothetical protein DL897_17680 [Thermoflavimicrobium daqui]
MSDKLLEQILSELKSLNQRMTNVENNMVTKTEFNELKEDVDGLKQDVKGLKEDANVLKEDVQEIKQDLALLAKQQHDDVIQLLKKMDNDITDIKSRTRSIENIQEQQHRVIDLLSSRSIQHEAELKRIK